MRASLIVLGLALTLGAAACHKAEPPAASVTPIQVAATGPAPTPGLWIERVSDRRGAQVSKICLDAAAAAAFTRFDAGLNGHCSRHDMAQAADGSWHFSTSCDMGPGGQVATEGYMHCDFASHYTIEARSQTVNAAQVAADGPSRVVADVRRAGDCPAGMRPGDVVLPDGTHTSLAQITRHA
jgi:hypothetical protein